MGLCTHAASGHVLGDEGLHTPDSRWPHTWQRGPTCPEAMVVAPSTFYDRPWVELRGSGARRCRSPLAWPYPGNGGMDLVRGERISSSGAELF